MKQGLVEKSEAREAFDFLLTKCVLFTRTRSGWKIHERSLRKMTKRINVSDEAIARLEKIPGMKPIIEEHGVSYAFEFVFFKSLGEEIPLTPKELKSIAAQERWKQKKQGKKSVR